MFAAPAVVLYHPGSASASLVVRWWWQPRSYAAAPGCRNLPGSRAREVRSSPAVDRDHVRLQTRRTASLRRAAPGWMASRAWGARRRARCRAVSIARVECTERRELVAGEHPPVIPCVAQAVPCAAWLYPPPSILRLTFRQRNPGPNPADDEVRCQR